MNRSRFALLTLLALLAGLVLSGCSTARAYSSQCAFIIGDGVGDDRSVKRIVYPGTRFTVGDDIVRYVPCNSRNFIIAEREENRDRTLLVEAKTKANGNVQPTRVRVALSSFFALNQKESALKEFVTFCEKYSCYSGEDKVGGDANYASKGWNDMLGENYSPAIDRAVATAMEQFLPNIWEERAEWSKVGEAISAVFLAEVQKATGSKEPFFCASGSDTRKGECAPPRFVIDNIVPTDTRLIQQQQDLAASKSQTDVNKARRTEAEKLYGSQTDYWVGLQDALQKCKETGQQCTVVIGGGGNVNVTPAAKQ